MEPGSVWYDKLTIVLTHRKFMDHQTEAWLEPVHPCERDISNLSVTRKQALFSFKSHA